MARAIELDPRNARLWTTAAAEYISAVRRREARQHSIARSEISPNDQYAISLKVQLFQQEGRLDEAAKELARLPTDSSDKSVLSTRIQQAVLNVTSTRRSSVAKQATDSLVPGKTAYPTGHSYSRPSGLCAELVRTRNEDARAHVRACNQGRLEQASRRSQLPTLAAIFPCPRVCRGRRQSRMRSSRRG